MSVIATILILVAAYFMYQQMLGRSEKGDFTLLAVGVVVLLFVIF